MSMTAKPQAPPSFSHGREGAAWVFPVTMSRLALGVAVATHNNERPDAQ